MIERPAFWLLLAATAVGVRVVPERWRWWLVAAASAGFLATLAPVSVAVLLGWATVVWAVARPAVSRTFRWSGTGLVVGLLSTLAAFKYVPPLVQTVTGGGPVGAVLIPLGISYYTFKLIHWVVEVGRGAIERPSMDRYFAWLLLFPSFPAGPIERYDHFERHLEDRPGTRSVAEGLIRIAHGLIKKLLLADGLLVVALGGLDAAAVLDGSAGAADVWRLLAIGYLRVYLDFSAYTDLAVGGGRLLGVRLVENFRWPVLATDLGEFWRRWHMSLVQWCQSYVYLPTIGLTRNPYVATIATFVAIGAWHAGSLHWIVWGLYHAAGVTVFRWWRRRRGPRRPSWAGRVVGWALTQGFVAAGGAFTMTFGVAPVGAGFEILLAGLGLG